MLIIRTVAMSILLSGVLLLNYYAVLVGWVVGRWPWLALSYSNPAYANLLGDSVAAFSVVLALAFSVSLLVCSVVWPWVESLLGQLWFALVKRLQPRKVVTVPRRRSSQTKHN